LLVPDGRRQAVTAKPSSFAKFCDSQLDADAVAVAAIGRDQKPRRVPVSRAPHCPPPTANGVDRAWFGTTGSKISSS
jgi:hypothetical protein